MSAPRYRHTQFGAVVVGSLAATTLVLAGLGLAQGNRVRTRDGPILMGAMALPFHSFAVEIGATHLRFRVGIGLVRKSISLADIVEVAWKRLEKVEWATLACLGRLVPPIAGYWNRSATFRSPRPKRLDHDGPRAAVQRTS